MRGHPATVIYASNPATVDGSVLGRAAAAQDAKLMNSQDFCRSKPVSSARPCEAHRPALARSSRWPKRASSTRPWSRTSSHRGCAGSRRWPPPSGGEHDAELGDRSSEAFAARQREVAAQNERLREIETPGSLTVPHPSRHPALQAALRARERGRVRRLAAQPGRRSRHCWQRLPLAD